MCNSCRRHRLSPSEPWRFFPAADTAFAPVFAVPSECGTGPAEAPAAATTVAQHAPSPLRTSQGADPAAIIDSTASTPSPPGHPAPRTALPPSSRISTRTRRITATVAIVESPAVDYVLGPGGASRPSARHAYTPPRVPRPRPPLAGAMAPVSAASPVPTVFITSSHDRAEPVGTPRLRLSPSPDVPSA